MAHCPHFSVAALFFVVVSASFERSCQNGACKGVSPREAAQGSAMLQISAKADTNAEHSLPPLIHETPVDVTSFREKGYIRIPAVFPTSVVDDFASIIRSYVKNKGKLVHPFGGGHTIANFVHEPHLSTVFAAVHSNQNIHGVIRQLFDGKSLGTGPAHYRFVGHDNINLGTQFGWHKDRLNGVYRAYEAFSPWADVNGATMQIVKVAMYLEDHSKKQDLAALRVVPGSHKVEEIPDEKYNVTFLHPAKGDVIIFDQRITHRGQGPMENTDHAAPGEFNLTSLQPQITHDHDDRIMLQLGYGVNNIHADSFALGSRMRQDMTNNPQCGYKSYSQCATNLIKADLKKRGIKYP